MSQYFSTHDGSAIVADLVSVIVANREYLSEVDGAIGDGDHGINMAKGFAHCGRTIEGRQLTLAEALDELTLSLMEGIGGPMTRARSATPGSSVTAACRNPSRWGNSSNS